MKRLGYVALLISYLTAISAGNGLADPGDQGRIVFHTAGDTVYIVNPDGSDLRLLSDDGLCAALSPDGTRVAFQRGGHGTANHIYVMDVDGGDAVRLTSSSASERHAAWSPDGTRIAFQSDRDGNPEIYVADLDGGGWHRVTDDPSEDAGPTWSPDGDRIAFYSDRDGNWEIYIAHLLTGAVRRLTHTPEKELAPAWSPDGTKIAFCSGPTGVFEGDIHVIRPDGTRERALTSLDGMQEHPAWSPDGTHVAFQSMNKEPFEICVVDTGGRWWRSVSNLPGHDYWPTWGRTPEAPGSADRSAVRLAPGDVHLQLVYDDNPHGEGFETDAGFSCLLRAGGATILFDAGRIPSIMRSNTNKLGIEPASIDHIVISHNHSDHVYGLDGLLDAGTDAELFVLEAMPQNMSQRAVDLVRGTIERAREEVGSVVDVTEPAEVCPGVSTTGPMGSRIPEQALVVRTEAGLVVVTGCGHPGVVAQVERARDRTGDEVLLVVGGFHLHGKLTAEIAAVVDGLLPLTRYVAPCHCSGPEARELFRETFGERFIGLGVGEVVNVGELAGE